MKISRQAWQVILDGVSAELIKLEEEGRNSDELSDEILTFLDFLIDYNEAWG